MRSVIFVLLSAFGCISAQKNFYKAAVVEYGSKRDPTKSPEDFVDFNAEQYAHFIRTAAENSVDIIVFPEYGLTSLEAFDKKEYLMNYSVEVPDPELKFNPCTNRTVDKPLVHLSCVAKENGIYTVINVLERVDNKTYHNTNVVFDRNGTIIARYRKINLYYESSLKPGTEVVTFKTDFGVEFGMFICFDILFEKPAIKVLRGTNVTDIIYSTAWFSETPFLSALTAQASYAFGNGVNLLASGYNRPKNGNGGSGIYLADGTADTFISGNSTTKLIMKDVPIITKHNSTDNCRNIQQSKNIIEGDLSKFKLTSNLENFTLKTLNETEISEGHFSCKFDVILEDNSTKIDEYEYKLAQFYGVRRYGERTAGIRSCAIVACFNNTCGAIVNGTKTPKVKRFALTASFKKIDEFIAPTGVTTNLLPASNYTFCITENDGKVTVVVNSTGTLESLLSLGFYSRVYANDGKKVGPISDSGALSLGWIIIIIIIAVIILSIVLYAGFKTFRRKRDYDSVKRTAE